MAAAVAFSLPSSGTLGAVSATTVASATAQMTAMSLTQTPVTAQCPPGTTLVGGGISLQPAVGGAPYTNGLKINGTGPGSGTEADGASNPTGWTAFGGFGGQSDPNDTVTASAVCATGNFGSTFIVAGAAVGSASNAAAGLGPVTATCPASTTLLGGGASAAPAADGSLKPIASYPSDAAGRPVAAGTSTPGSWSAASRNSSAGGPSDTFPPTTTVFALCGRAAIRTVVAEASTVLSTATSGAVQRATTTCPAGDLLLSGGIAIDDGAVPPGPSQFGVHLIVDDATTAAGGVVTNGPATSWTATAHTGGIPATVGVHAFALCTASSPPAGSLGGSTPGSTPGSSGSAAAGTASIPTAPAGTGGPSAAASNGPLVPSAPATLPAVAPSGDTSVPASSGGALGSTATGPRSGTPDQAAAAFTSRPAGPGSPTLTWVLVILSGVVVAIVVARRRVFTLITRKDH